MNHDDARAILATVSEFQTRAEKVKRYEGNPFVKGDAVSDHVARAARLLVYITPDLKKEFPGQPQLVQEIFSCLIIHDDDEVIAGFDVPSATKRHNENDQEEVRRFAEAVTALPAENKDFVVAAFGDFRTRTSLAAKIAKALDNLTGNQLVIDQKLALINPDSAKFCIEYARKVAGASKTTDALVEVQVEQVTEFRDQLKTNQVEMETIRKQLDLPNVEKIQKLLAIDVMNHVLDKTKVYTAIDML